MTYKEELKRLEDSFPNLKKNLSIFAQENQ